MGLFKLGGLAMLFIFVGMVLGMFIAGGGEIEGAPVLDDPSRAQVDGEWIKWIELRDAGVYAGTEETPLWGGNRDVRITLPSGETHPASEQHREELDDPIVYVHEQPELPAGNYTVKIMSQNMTTYEDEVDASYTVYLEPPET